MPKLTANGITLHYLQTGRGPNLVMLHGNGGNLAVWHLKLTSLLKDDFCMTTYDLRGHGRSEMPATGYTSLEQAEDLAGLLDALALDRVHLVGHSYGGDIAMHFVSEHPDRVDRLAVIEPNVTALIERRKDAGWEGWTYWAQRLEEETGVPVPPDKCTDADYLLRQSVNVPIKYGPFKGRRRNRGWMLKLLDTTSLVEDYQKVAGLTLDRIQGISRPMLAVYGNTSHFSVTYDFFRDQVPQCRTVLLENSDHYGPLEHPDLVSRHLRQFFLANGPSATSPLADASGE